MVATIVTLESRKKTLKSRKNSMKSRKKSLKLDSIKFFLDVNLIYRRIIFLRDIYIHSICNSFAIFWVCFVAIFNMSSLDKFFASLHIPCCILKQTLLFFLTHKSKQHSRLGVVVVIIFSFIIMISIAIDF